MVKPYYSKNGIIIYCGDCEKILPQLPEVDLLLTDPPYGIGADRNLRANKQHGKAVAPSRDYGKGDWDDKTPSVELLQKFIALSARSIIWGGNYFPLEPSPCWLVWDKLTGNNGYADCELAWTNLNRAVRKFTWRWQGMLRDGKEQRWHPTQKPLALMRWCISLGLKGTELILDPYMGSGTTLVAAQRMKLRAIGIEKNREYCDAAIGRLGGPPPKGIRDKGFQLWS